VLVLRNMADKAKAILDRAADRCLSASAGGEAADLREIAVLRHLSDRFAILLVAVTLSLSFFYGPAVALPLGFAAVVSLFLLCAVALIGIRRATTPAADAGTPIAEIQPRSPFDVCPGLILALDTAGHVREAAGRDRDMFLSFLRDPFGRPFAEQVHVSDRIAFVQALDELRRVGAILSAGVTRDQRFELAEAVYAVFVRSHWKPVVGCASSRTGQG